MYRASTGDLSYIDDHPGRGAGGRWDRDRFERMRGARGGGGPGRDDFEHYRFQKHEQYPGMHRDIDIHRDVDRRGPRVAERERYHEEEDFGRPSRRRHEIFDEPTPSEVANRALAPYRGRRKSVVGEEIDISIKRPARPGYIRRQSSLDTFDRRPLPRYHEHEREEWRPPTNVPIPLPIRERRRSPPRRLYDDDYDDEFRYREYERERERERERDREPRGRPREEYREVEIRREKSTRRARSRSRAARSIAATSVRSSSSSSFEEVQAPVQQPVGRKGRTRMPKRLVKKQAIIELGYPFEEEVCQGFSLRNLNRNLTLILRRRTSSLCGALWRKSTLTKSFGSARVTRKPVSSPKIFLLQILKRL